MKDLFFSPVLGLKSLKFLPDIMYMNSTYLTTEIIARQFWIPGLKFCSEVKCRIGFEVKLRVKY